MHIIHMKLNSLNGVIINVHIIKKWNHILKVDQCLICIDVDDPLIVGLEIPIFFQKYFSVTKY